MDDNSKYKELFFEETEEYLQLLNDNMLRIEQDINDIASLEEMFRAAHSLKGMAATMGYKSMTDLTHRMESLLGLLKSGESFEENNIINLIFRCLDKLTEIVEDLKNDKDNTYVQDIIEELEQVISKDNTPKNVKKEELEDFTLSDTDYNVIKSAYERGYNAYAIDVTVDDGCVLKGPRAYLVINNLEKIGDVIYTYPDAQSLENGEYNKTFRLILLTKETIEDIKEKIENISEIENVEIIEIQPNYSIEENNSKENIKENKKVETKLSNNTNLNQSIRVDIQKLDSFMNLVSELVIYRTRLEDVSKRTDINEIDEPLSHVARITSELQDLVLKIRMQPVSVVFNRFPRMIRDLSKELNKKINLIIEGEETELDRTVVSELSEPLIHLIRNAADHGIEPVETRKKLNKPEEGEIKLNAYQEGNRVIIVVSDDGAGINTQAIKETAERRGINTENLTEEDLLQLIFDQGFSTAKVVTDVSGRGVGMDVVKQKISSLGGTIEVISELNKGTSFIIKLPLTLSIIQALLVKIGGETFAIPLGIIEKVVKIEEKEILKSQLSELYMYREMAVPVVRINQKLGLEKSGENQHLILTLLGDQYYGLLVDELIGQQEIVIKKLNGILGKMKEYLGATILGNGDITLILDVGSICMRL
ncbi:MAG: chemotaxis protein CheA [Tissierellales bacterium]|nr:chemotaxis protein CheA [Tissierellales bacterium]